MNGLRQHLLLSLRLYFRNRMAMLYGYLFPTIFLIAFWVLYRSERIPLIRHMGEVLTVTILGGACFGLATTLVADRERGVWRRIKLAPIPISGLIASTLVARYLLLLSAGLLQLVLALALGMPLPGHPWELLVAFSFAAFAFLGLGLVIAMLADNVPSVQALGQVIFLPMLIIGGVAVPLVSLPGWALHVSVYFPGRHAVEAIQAAVNGNGLGDAGFSLFALFVIGVAACIAGAGLFRWDARQRFATTPGKAWLAVALAGWVGVGLLAQAMDQVLPLEMRRTPPIVVNVPAEGEGEQPEPQAPWQMVTTEQFATLDFSNVETDFSNVTPVHEYESVEHLLADVHPLDRAEVDRLRLGLATWEPAQLTDPLASVRNLLLIAAVLDVRQYWLEGIAPVMIFDYLQRTVEQQRLLQLLYWLSIYPDAPGVPPLDRLHEVLVFSPSSNIDMQDVNYRISIYALKLLGRITGLRPPQ